MSVVLIKLAERTYSLRELANSSRERQERVAREILTSLRQSPRS